MQWDEWARPHETTLTFDEVERPVQIARLSVGQKANFQAGLERLMGTRGMLPESPTTEERDAFDTERRRENLLKGDWLNDTVLQYIRVVEPWTSAEGIPVASAADLLQAYQDETILTACVLTVWTHNTLSAALRKNLPSPSALLRSLAARTPAANGEPPAPTAAPAEPADSAAPDAATAVPA